MLLRGALQRLAHGHDFARGLTAGDGPGVRGAHHHALKHGLSADQSFFAAFERGQKLNGGEKSQVISEFQHEYWMLLASARRSL